MRKIFWALSAVIMIACSENKFDVKLTESVDLQVQRFELAFDSLKNKDLDRALPSFIKNYGKWLELYSGQIIRTGSVYDAQFPERIQAFFNYPEYGRVASDISTKFPADSSLSTVLEKAFSYYHYYFPEDTLPAIYTYNGGFNQSVVIGEGMIGAGLDKYLGADYEMYKRLGIDQYKIDRMEPNQLPYDLVYAYCMSEKRFNFKDENVLAEIIHEGRIMYLLHACFPFAIEHEMWGVPESKLKWLLSSERSMWEYMIDKEVLFDTEYLTIKKFTGEGPFTAAFSKESPARAAVWVGYRIVSQFVENTGTDMTKLFEMDDYQYILNKSKYNP